MKLRRHFGTIRIKNNFYLLLQGAGLIMSSYSNDSGWLSDVQSIVVVTSGRS